MQTQMAVMDLISGKPGMEKAPARAAGKKSGASDSKTFLKTLQDVSREARDTNDPDQPAAGQNTGAAPQDRGGENDPSARSEAETPTDTSAAGPPLAETTAPEAFAPETEPAAVGAVPVGTATPPESETEPTLLIGETATVAADTADTRKSGPASGPPLTADSRAGATPSGTAGRAVAEAAPEAPEGETTAESSAADALNGETDEEAESLKLRSTMAEPEPTAPRSAGTSVDTAPRTWTAGAKTADPSTGPAIRQDAGDAVQGVDVLTRQAPEQAGTVGLETGGALRHTPASVTAMDALAPDPAAPGPESGQGAERVEIPAFTDAVEGAKGGTGPSDTGTPSRSAPPEFLSQIVERATVIHNRGQSEMRMVLKPEFLGQVRMQIITENQHLTVRIVAESHGVREAIENNLGQLKADLADQGLKVDAFDVRTAADSHGQGQKSRAFFAGRNDSGREPLSDADADIIPILARVGMGHIDAAAGRVDYFA